MVLFVGTGTEKQDPALVLGGLKEV